MYMTEEELKECEQAEREKHDEKLRELAERKERIRKMSRPALIMEIQGLLNDPDIRTEDLSDGELRRLLQSIK